MIILDKNVSDINEVLWLLKVQAVIICSVINVKNITSLRQGMNEDKEVVLHKKINQEDGSNYLSRIISTDE